jgi:hypothetical protein
MKYTDGMIENGKDHHIAPATGFIQVASTLTEATTVPSTKKLVATLSAQI